MTTDLAPTLFVAMPFGTKLDPSGRQQIDFDHVWNACIRLACEDVGVEAVRADEERVGGVVHAPMFERLLLSDVVIADLTLASPNVFYELGIRHAARPRSTILITAALASLPFDLASMRALPYHLTKRGRLRDTEAAKLRAALAASLKDRLDDRESTDSPLFQLIRSYPGIILPHDATDLFQDRVRVLEGHGRRIRQLGRQKPAGSGLPELLEMAEDLLLTPQIEPALLIDLLLALRDCEAWTAMVDYTSSLPADVQRHKTVREQLALALNRRAVGEDRSEAVRILTAVLSDYGTDAETLGILGRVYKSEYIEQVDRDPTAARFNMKRAAKTYRLGFEADPRDFYPGINAATLYLCVGSKKSLRRMRELLGPLAFAVARRGSLTSHIYWDVATVGELALLRRSRPTAQRAFARALTLPSRDWERKTTLGNVKLISGAWVDRGRPLPWIDEIIAQLEESLDSPNQ